MVRNWVKEESQNQALEFFLIILLLPGIQYSNYSETALAFVGHSDWWIGGFNWPEYGFVSVGLQTGKFRKACGECQNRVPTLPGKPGILWFTTQGLEFAQKIGKPEILTQSLGKN